MRPWLLLCAALVVCGATCLPGILTRGAIDVDASSTVGQVAAENGLKPGQLLHELGHELPSVRGLSADTVVGSVPGGVDALRHVVAEGGGHRSSPQAALRLVSTIAWSAMVVFLILPRGVTPRARLGWMVLVVVAFGVGFGTGPNPMESLVKVFKLTVGLESDARGILGGLAVVLLLTLLAPKLVCSWACPLGALQELLRGLLPARFLRRLRVGDRVTIVVRLVLFLVFLVVLYGFRTVIYHHVNFFKLFRPWTLSPVALYALPVLVIAAIVVYRPFCRFVCPFGLVSWLVEPATWARPTVAAPLCTECGACVRACPSDAMTGYLAGTPSAGAECWSCGACVVACPTKAVGLGEAAPRQG